MSSTNPSETSLAQPMSNNWYLVSVRSKKRELFLKYLKISIEQNQLQELVLDIRVPSDSVYEDIVLLNLANFRTAYTHLQKVECFQNIERKPLQTEQVNRMLGLK
jgi:transcription antitermination factor NusG